MHLATAWIFLSGNCFPRNCFRTREFSEIFSEAQFSHRIMKFSFVYDGGMISCENIFKKNWWKCCENYDYTWWVSAINVDMKSIVFEKWVKYEKCMRSENSCRIKGFKMVYLRRLFLHIVEIMLQVYFVE